MGCVPIFNIISIVTPSYNQGQFIEECIRSVISQEGDFRIEYLIMDGGSTDGSVEIIRKYEDLLARGQWPVRCQGITYRWLSEKDKGQADAINKGFRMAEGEVVAWINSDDYYLPGAFQTAAAAIGPDSSLAMVYGDGFVVEDGSGSKRASGIEPFFDLWKLIHLYDFISQPSVFLRHDSL